MFDFIKKLKTVTYIYINRFMDAEGKWWPSHFAVAMMELTLDSLQVK